MHDLTEEERVEEYFRINVTVPLLDEVVTSMKARFEGGQSSGTMLIPACAITERDWKSHCVAMYSDDLPSKHTLSAELDLWEQKWTKEWEARWKELQQQHTKGECLVVNPSELKRKGVPSNVASTLVETNPLFSPNIYQLLINLAVLATCHKL